ncbi:hypothetical protein J437_LFUL004877 [Ladona fulva]|uniref:Uncharacterized protein n=1 Tax=Ladona fulva TaxID=123851 RepID=A0A8K0JY54_LADFU|nr:hypothetical protein J437_LFUL004877 [Ladona fulva]
MFAMKLEIVLAANGSHPFPTSMSFLKVENCHKVSVLENAISSLVAIRHIEIQHVRQLVLQPNAFNWSQNFSGVGIGEELGLTTVLKNASLPEIPSYTFRGKHTSILLENLKISVIRQFAFANLDNGISPFLASPGKLRPYPDPYHPERTIEIRECDIDNVESMSFRRFAAAEIKWLGGRVGAFHARALLDITVKGYEVLYSGHHNTRQPEHRHGLGINGGLKMQNVHVGRIGSSAFYLLRLSALQIINTTFVIFESGAISGFVDKPIIRQSQFGKLSSGSFLGISPDTRFGSYTSPVAGVTFIFQNNTVTRFENASLLFHPGYRLQSEDIRIDIACLCSSLWRWTLTLTGSTPVTNTKDSTIVQSPKHLPPEAVALFSTLLCRPDDGEKYVFFSQVEKNMCKNGLPIGSYSGPGVLIIVVLVALGVALIVTLVAILCIRKKRRNNTLNQGKAWIGVPTTERQRKNRVSGSCADEDTSRLTNGEPRGKEYMVVMPGLKTYHETELHVIVERAEPIVMEGVRRADEDAKSQLLEFPDHPDAEKTSL